LTRASETWSRGPAPWIFLAGGLWILLQWPLGLHGAGFGPGFEVLNVARSLAFHGRFADPFSSAATGPTGHVAPLYPALLAPILRLFPDHTAVYPLFFLNAILVGLAAAQLPGVSRRLFRTVVPGVIGAVLLIFASRLAPQQEQALSVLLIVAAASSILARHPWRSGVFTGLAVLCDPLAVLLLPVLMIRRGRRFILIAVATAFAIVAPWMIRNWVIIGAPYFVRDGLGLELELSNNSQARPDLLFNGPLHATHPMYNRQQALLVAQYGEGAYNHLQFSAAMDWCRLHPARFLYLCFVRAWHYWLPPPIQGWPAYVYWPCFCGGLAGLWLCRENREVRWLALGAVLYWLPYILIQSDLRYGYPALFIPALLAGRFVAHALVRAPRHRASRKYA